MPDKQQTEQFQSEADEFLNRLKTSRESHELPRSDGADGKKQVSWHKSVVGFFAKLRRRRVPHPDPSVRHLENQEELIKWLRIQARLLTPVHSFYRGIATGLGVIVGTTIVLSVILAILGKLALVPIIGEFARDILDYIGNGK